MGQRVAVVAGDYRNIKVTTPADLLIATALLDSLKEKSA
jgi:2-C-methyl-D-erythritol 4-phosphate cytidylyltransferase